MMTFIFKEQRIATWSLIKLMFMQELTQINEIDKIFASLHIFKFKLKLCVKKKINIKNLKNLS
jgi:hypothetical protein